MIRRVAALSLLVVAVVMTACEEKKEEVKAEVKTEVKTEQAHRQGKPQQIAMRARDPVCGKLVETGEGTEAVFEGETYHFCSERCMRQFLADPHEYLRGTPVFDPVCGMRVEWGKSPHAKYQGKRYHFCSKECKTEFEKNPGKYVKVNE